ncbi:hypothetical protein ACTHQ4_05770 [Alkalicoccobacillus gibsonii]|uniref:hypothetical protein n=1 Tax=Alkalicoccobacillus gibsonii TaxID=79881 RepID=UPI003F7CD129
MRGKNQQREERINKEEAESTMRGKKLTKKMLNQQREEEINKEEAESTMRGRYQQRAS